MRPARSRAGAGAGLARPAGIPGPPGSAPARRAATSPGAELMQPRRDDEQAEHDPVAADEQPGPLGPGVRPGAGAGAAGPRGAPRRIARPAAQEEDRPAQRQAQPDVEGQRRREQPGAAGRRPARRPGRTGPPSRSRPPPPGCPGSGTAGDGPAGSAWGSAACGPRGAARCRTVAGQPRRGRQFSTTRPSPHWIGQAMARIRPTRLVQGAASTRAACSGRDHDPGAPDDRQRGQADERRARSLKRHGKQGVLSRLRRGRGRLDDGRQQPGKPSIAQSRSPILG